MKKLILLAIVTSCVSCSEPRKETATEIQKENMTPAKTTVKCDSADMKVVDPKTGLETTTRIWRCDSDYHEGPHPTDK